MRSEVPGEVKKIAVFRPLFLSDLMLAVPALRGLRAFFPKAEITLIGLPWAESFATRFMGYVDRFATFPGYPGIDVLPYEEAQTVAFLEAQAAVGYDLAFQMHGCGPADNEFVNALKASCTVGYYDPEIETGEELSISAPYPARITEVYRNLGLLDLVGVANRGDLLEYPILPEDRARAAEIISENRLGGGLLIGLHVGASDPSRRWPLEKFAELGDDLATRFGAKIILTGAPDEVDAVESVSSRMRTASINLAGQTDLGALGAMIESMDLFISNDTGPAYIALALDVPSVTIVGRPESEDSIWSRLDPERHRYIQCEVDLTSSDIACLESISPQQVLEAAKSLLEVASNA